MVIRGTFEIHPVRNVSKQVQCVAVASFADHCRRPKPRPDVDHDEDPDRLLLASDDRSDLIGLKFYRREPSYFSIIEPTTPGGCSFQPTMNRIPGDSLDSSDGGLVQAFDTERGDFIKGRATVLESIIRCAGCRAECLPTSLALVATTLSPPGLVEAMANDGSDAVFPEGGQCLLGQLRLFMVGGPCRRQN